MNRTYAREIKKLKHQLRFARKPKNMKKLRKAQTRLHRIAWKIYHDLNSKLNPMPMIYIKEFDVLYRVLTQKGDDSNKVYSILEPEVLFISKGRGHKPYGVLTPQIAGHNLKNKLGLFKFGNYVKIKQKIYT